MQIGDHASAQAKSNIPVAMIVDTDVVTTEAVVLETVTALRLKS